MWNSMHLIGLVCFVQVLIRTNCEVLSRPKPAEPGLADADYVRNELLHQFENIWLNIRESNNVDVDGEDLKLLEKFFETTKNLTEATNRVDKSALKPLTLDINYAQLDDEINNIEKYFETFRRFQRDYRKQPRRSQLAWTDLAIFLLDETDKGIIKTLGRIHNQTLNELKLAAEQSQSEVCEMEVSPQQMIYNLYNLIGLADLKGFTMLQFSWMLLKLYDKGNFTREAEIMQNIYTERTMQKVNAAREAMSGVDRSVFRCDPKQWIEGENYARLTKLLQGYIENEVNFNTEGTCRENCAYYQVTEYHHCFKEQFCSKQPPCHGKVIQCRYIDSDMNICQSSNPERRYDYVEYENGSILGQKRTCPNKFFSKVDSWWRYLFWHCSYCFCLCDDNHQNSDRYINLRPVLTDIKNNKVVTGVRFTKEKQIIHLQLQQGQLLPRGLINTSSIEWIPVQNYSIMDHNIEDGVDYHTLTWLDRAIDLDDVSASNDHVFTGVRFRKLGLHLNLEIRATPFDFQKGLVFTEEESYWIGNDNTDASLTTPRSELFVPDGDVAIRIGPNMPQSKHDQFLKFRESSVKADAAQSTVPYIDTQPLTSHGLVLSGMGLLYRGRPNSGGLLAPKLISYDFGPHLIVQEPNNLS